MKKIMWYFAVMVAVWFYLVVLILPYFSFGWTWFTILLMWVVTIFSVIVIPVMVVITRKWQYLLLSVVLLIISFAGFEGKRVVTQMLLDNVCCENPKACGLKSDACSEYILGGLHAFYGCYGCNNNNESIHIDKVTKYVDDSFCLGPMCTEDFYYCKQ